MARVGALWIGGLEHYMDEAFLTNAMVHMNQEGVVSIKVMTNKFTGGPAGYGFINFDSDQKAIYVMHRLGGKVIPNSDPPVRFKLNHNSTRLGPGEPDTSIWVGDLTPEVDDFMLYQFFIQRYQTVRCAKVVLDDSGMSKGYGFVRFGNEAEQQHALNQMSGELGLGSKPIKVSLANQKNRNGASGGGGPFGNNGSNPRSHGSSGSALGWSVDAVALAGGNGAGPESWTGPGGPGGVAAAAAASPSPGGWPAAVSAPPGSTHLATGPHHPEQYSAYQQYYNQYAQQFSQQQQYAAAWSAWQQQQQQQ